MGLFFWKKPTVHVHGRNSDNEGMDGRYQKQVRRQQKEKELKLKDLPLEPHTVAELRGYIEAAYGVEELEHTDTRYREAFIGVKAHLVELYAPEKLKTPAPERPKHPVRSDSDPDYAAYYAGKEQRFQEAVLLPVEEFPIHLHVYCIALFQGETPVSWVEVYVERDHAYLAFKVTDLEYENHYRTERVIRDIVNYFGASEEDKAAGNERYVQYCSVQ
ncbi:MAG: hypothetical protein J6Z23_03915 [Lachnospiraceae bacterium]|nr:hypothetical protein [Lachnospiraceae bacterium]